MADYSYQPKLIKDVFSALSEHKKALLAACPGAGKTRMTLKVIERFRKEHPRARIMVFAHGQVLLRDQWADVIKEHGTFPFRVIEASSDLKQVGNEVMIAIPQTLLYAKKLPKIDLLIVDEAHHFCEADSTKKLIARLGAEYELRLTGTPAIYVGKDEWKVTGVTVQDLLEHDVLCDPRIELVKADYKYNLGDYLNQTMNLKPTVRLEKRETVSTLDRVLKQLSERLYRKKVMYICQNQDQARDVHEYFSNRGVRSVLSISDLNYGTDEVASFKNDPECFAFIVVNRGTLGFDYDKLTAIVDMSGSLNVNKLFQMLCRVVRRDSSNPDHKKYFIKLATPEMAIITHFVMSFVVSLSDSEYYYSYKIEDTKNARIPVPAELMNPHKGHSGPRGEASSERPFPDLPPLYTFKDIKAIREGAITTYAITDFATVRKLLRKQPERKYNIDAILDLARKFKTRNEFKKAHRNQYSVLARNKLLHLLDPILPPLRKNRDDWTVEEVLKLSKQFRSKSEFRVAYHGAFKWMKRQGKLDLLKFEGGNIRWTAESALAFARKCKSRKDFKRKKSSAYGFLCDNGHLEELEKIFPITRTLWDLETALAEAQKYRSRSEFKQNAPGAYTWLAERGHVPKLYEVFPDRYVRLKKTRRINAPHRAA